MADHPWGLSDQGLEVPRFADYLTLIRDQYEAETGLQLDWGRDTFLGNITALMAQQLDQNAQLLHAVYDAQDPESASGVHLDKLCALTYVTRIPARASTVTLELTGDVGVTVPAGQHVEDNARQRWITDQAVTLIEQEGQGKAQVDAHSEEVGNINADAETITKIITPVAGWLSVTNPQKATAGRERETDSELRQRRKLSLQVQGGSSCAAIRGKLLALDFVKSAEVFDNPSNSTKTIAGVTAPPHTVVVYIYGKNSDGSLQDADQKREVAEVLYTTLSAGVRTAGNDESWAVTTADGAQNVVQWSYSEAVPVDVIVTLTGVNLTSVVVDATTNIIQAHFRALRVGETVHRLPLIVALAKLDGVTGVEVLFDGVDADVDVEPYQVATTGVPTILQG
ncbi:hypothetical protein DL240_09165 [Lujinxingia litoralis]|uniref:Baseplate protein J-like barrel domain-containing protein n=1 Tax=Lujinxingia litoralis TaxID=2211119 RepID=A0A328CA52_9DELT|nr:baseplate J/gp47 family protein [Lujinxingia litoralis]RAL23045.1 hypothetical protein DL240_09165 [Lujinxingia litoralis]